MHPLGQDPGGVRGEQRDGDVSEAVVGQAERQPSGAADDQAHDHAPRGHQHELHERLGEHEAAGDRGGDRRPVQNQRGGVVDQALALEHVDQSLR